MTQNATKRPRVAAIGLNEPQIESIEPLCGTLRAVNSLEEYLKKYAWPETDVTILGDGLGHVAVKGNILMIGTLSVTWEDHVINLHKWQHFSTRDNTERETQLSKVCPERYKHLAEELARRLNNAEDPPPRVISQGAESLVETTSGYPVALRSISTNDAKVSDSGATIALALPRKVSLSAWFRAFLSDIHELDRDKVPQAPPRLGNPSDWYTPEERALAKRIAEISDEVEQLKDERERIQVELADAIEKAEVGIRRCIWADGEELVASIGDVLEKLGFVVRHMDAGLQQGEPKREDLRLTLADRPEWEAIAEVKGYPKSTKTNDSRQIREQRERYIGKKLSTRQ